MMTGPVRAWSGRAVAALLALLVAGLLGALAIEVAWRHDRWHAELQGVRFLDHPEKISGRAAAMTVTGYVVATLRSDVDFFALARAEGAHPIVRATLCESQAELGAWSSPLPADGGPPFSYAVLIPLRGAQADLARGAEDICLRLVARSLSPLSGIASTPVVVPLAALRDQLADYARADGPVVLELDPACLPRLCQPDFSPDDLRR